jgi:hypothetical protein
MTQDGKVGDLFKEDPPEWSLRGDPYLWSEMKMQLSQVLLPKTPEELKTILNQSFLELTGKALTSRKHFYVAKFAHGGMSSGHVDPTFWRSKVIPLLIRRYKGKMPENREQDRQG